MLVRDPIYNMIMSSRRLPKVKKLAPTKYQNALHVKLSKKAFEVGTTCTRHELLTELADVQEKVDALLEANNATYQEHQAEHHRRHCARSKFSKQQCLQMCSKLLLNLL